MNSEHQHDDTTLDARLAGLPQWQPPADFTARLAAAATRQAAEPVATHAPSTLAWLWERCMQHLPLAVVMGLAALVLALLPWAELAANPLFPWLIAGTAAAGGVALTLRLLRAP